jgi:hypothetical protein
MEVEQAGKTDKTILCLPDHSFCYFQLTGKQVYQLRVGLVFWDLKEEERQEWIESLWESQAALWPAERLGSK